MHNGLPRQKALGAEVVEVSSLGATEPPGSFALTIDADGSNDSLALALRAVEPGGVCQRVYGDFRETTPVSLRHMYGIGATLKIGRVNARARLPECLEHVRCGHYHPELMLTRRARFEDAHEAIKDPTMKVVFLREGIE
jgi:alcohol dehydrogenase